MFIPHPCALWEIIVFIELLFLHFSRDWSLNETNNWFDKSRPLSLSLSQSPVVGR